MRDAETSLTISERKSNFSQRSFRNDMVSDDRGRRDMMSYIKWRMEGSPMFKLRREKRVQHSVCVKRVDVTEYRRFLIRNDPMSRMFTSCHVLESNNKFYPSLQVLKKISRGGN